LGIVSRFTDLDRLGSREPEAEKESARAATAGIQTCVCSGVEREC